jgi:hypothetical protein
MHRLPNDKGHREPDTDEPWHGKGKWWPVGATAEYLFAQDEDPPEREAAAPEHEEGSLHYIVEASIGHECRSRRRRELRPIPSVPVAKTVAGETVLVPARLCRNGIVP